METCLNALETFRQNNEKDHTVFSEINEKCKSGRCYVGIDEAGRGPVLGPMVYGIFACVADEDGIKEKLDKGMTLDKVEESPPILLNVAKLNDSKQLTDVVREEIFKQVADLDYIGFGVKFIAPMTISKKSFSRQRIGLNEVSHDAAIELIQGLIDRGVNIARVYVDTVGPKEKYQRKLEGIFPELKFRVDNKADAKYKPVSAASIFAKVCRDRAVSNWKFPDNLPPSIGLKGWGSGYPGDPVTKSFLRQNIDPVFGFPNIVRNSWATASDLLKKTAAKIEWEEEESAEAPAPKITKFFSKTNGDSSAVPQLSKPKSQFFSFRQLHPLSEF